MVNLVSKQGTITHWCFKRGAWIRKHALRRSFDHVKVVAVEAFCVDLLHKKETLQKNNKFQIPYRNQTCCWSMFILLRTGRAILIILIFNDFLGLLRWKECRSRCSTSWQWLGWLGSCWCFCQISLIFLKQCSLIRTYVFFQVEIWQVIAFFFVRHSTFVVFLGFLLDTERLMKDKQWQWKVNDQFASFCIFMQWEYLPQNQHTVADAAVEPRGLGRWFPSSYVRWHLLESIIPDNRKKPSEVSEKNTWKAWTFTENYDSLIVVSSVFFCSWNSTPLDEGPCHSSPRTSSQVFSALTNPPWKGLKMTMGSGVAPSLIFTPQKVELLVWKLYKDIATVHSQHLDDSPTYFLLKKWFNLLQKVPKMKFRHFNLLHSLRQLLRIWCAVYISIFLEARWIVGEA